MLDQTAIFFFKASETKTFQMIGCPLELDTIELIPLTQTQSIETHSEAIRMILQVLMNLVDLKEIQADSEEDLEEVSVVWEVDSARIISID